MTHGETERRYHRGELDKGGSDRNVHRRRQQLFAAQSTLRHGYLFESTNKGGGSSDFEDTFDDLSPGETYDWEAVLCYWDTDLDSWVETSYSDSGSFTMEGSSSGGNVYINTGTASRPNWARHRAIINIGTASRPNWVEFTPVINYGTYRNPDWR